MADWAGDLIKGSGCYLRYGLDLASSLKLMAIGGVSPVPPFNPAACIPPGIDDDFVGTTFECYEIGWMSGEWQQAGKNLNEIESTWFSVLFGSDEYSNYSDNDSVNGLNSGERWGGAYVARSQTVYPVTRAHDDFSDYNNNANVNGLDLGTNWISGYVAKDATANIMCFTAHDDFIHYTDDDDIDGLDYGACWDGAYSARGTSI